MMTQLDMIQSAHDIHSQIGTIMTEKQDPSEDYEVKYYPTKPFYSTNEVAELAGVSSSAVRMAKLEKRITPDETLSTKRDTWYAPDEVQRFANERDIYIVFTIAS